MPIHSSIKIYLHKVLSLAFGFPILINACKNFGTHFPTRKIIVYGGWKLWTIKVKRFTRNRAVVGEDWGDAVSDLQREVTYSVSSFKRWLLFGTIEPPNLIGITLTPLLARRRRQPAAVRCYLVRYKWNRESHNSPRYPDAPPLRRHKDRVGDGRLNCRSNLLSL